MKKQVRSMRGELIDFDLQSIKSQIEQQPAPHTVQARQDFIDKKMRRRMKKVKDDLLNIKATKVDRKIADAPTKETQKMDDKRSAVAEKATQPAIKRPIKRKPTN